MTMRCGRGRCVLRDAASSGSAAPQDERKWCRPVSDPSIRRLDKLDAYSG
jgi:hypothetical protein